MLKHDFYVTADLIDALLFARSALFRLSEEYRRDDLAEPLSMTVDRIDAALEELGVDPPGEWQD